MVRRSLAAMPFDLLHRTPGRLGRRAAVLVLTPVLLAVGGPTGGAAAAATRRPPSAAGPIIARIATAELRRGSGEAPRGSNGGPDVGRYRTATTGAVAGSPWCAYFASWVQRAAGHPIGPGGRGVSSAGELARWAREVHRWSGRPQVGGLLVLPEHVGVVVAIHGATVTSIDGNWSDRVTRVTRPVHEAAGYVSAPEPRILLMDAFVRGPLAG